MNLETKFKIRISFYLETKFTSYQIETQFRNEMCF